MVYKPMCVFDQITGVQKKNSHQSVMIVYFTDNAFDLLQNITKYLNRELRIPEYAGIFKEKEFDQADFDKETE